MIPTTINAQSPSVDVYAAIRGFIFIDTDGSQRVNVDGLTAWLANQFSKLPAGGTSLAAKSSAAAAIAQNLQSAISREAFRSRPDYPRSESLTVSTSAQNQLIELRAAIQDETKKIEANYSTFFTRVAASLKTLFLSTVAESITGVKLIEVTRAYLETFVTDRGEESRPSPASVLITLDQNDGATITCGPVPPGRFITRRRLYRSATTTNSAVWRLQGEYPAAQDTIADTKPDSELNDVLVTTGWLEPPANLQGLTGMSNGIMVGYTGSTMHACEPYAPYAWPAKYDKPFPYKIMGIASIGQSVLVGTTGFPYLVSGSDSMSLTEQKLPTLVPCIAAASMVPVANSVFYASPDGLALYENGAVAVVTEGIIDRADWARYNPASMRAAGFDGRYFAFYTKPDNTRGCLVFDYKSRTIAEMAQPADAAFANQNGLYVLNGTQLLNALPADGAPRTGLWRSKVFRLVKPQSFCWLHVDSEFAAGAVAVRIYADGVLHDTIIVADRAPVRVAPGRYHDWTIEVESVSEVAGIVLASSTDELKAVL